VSRGCVPKGASADHDLACLRERADACGLMDPLAPVAAPSAQSLGGVETDANLWGESVLAPVISEPPLDRDRTLHRGAGVVEGHEKTVSCVVDFLPVVFREERSKGLVVRANNVGPGLVPDRLD
jgi:hypothetical protein